MTPETLAKYRDLLDGLKSGSRTVERVTHEVGDFFDDGTMLVTACEWDYKIRCKTLLDVKFMSKSPTMVRELIEEVEKFQTQLEAQKKALKLLTEEINFSVKYLNSYVDSLEDYNADKQMCRGFEKALLEAKTILNEAGLG